MCRCLYRFKMISDSHISFTSSKISKSLSILLRLRNFVPQTVLLNLHRSFIQAHLSNGVAVWGQVAQSKFEKVLIMQKRAHSVPFVNLSNIFPLHQTYFKTICSFMHDFVNDLAPSNISELFSYSSEKHYHYTRSSAAGNLCFKYSRTKHMKNSFSRLGARLWNSIPICLLSRPKYKFKWYT